MEELPPSSNARRHSGNYNSTQPIPIVKEEKTTEKAHSYSHDVFHRILAPTPRRNSINGKASNILLNGTKVLHVEDLAMNRMITEKGVLANGWNYIGVESGEEVIELIKDEENIFHVVLMDIGLKGKMNGYETAEAILKLKPHQLIFSSSGSPIKKDKQHLFKGNLGKIGGKERVREGLSEALIA